MIQPEVLKARFYRKIIFTSAVSLFFIFLIGYFIKSAQELMLPIILGGFFGYLFRPLLGSIKGSPGARLVKGFFLAAMIVGGFYVAIKGIQSALPNPKEKLELLVRLQYRLNLRYNQWMGLEEGADKGNWVHNMVGKETDPLVKKMNHFLSLDQDQRKQFLAYRKGADGYAPISDNYYQYFLANLSSMQSAENLEQEAAAAAENQTTVGPVPVTAEAPGSGIAHMLRLLSIWIVFPLVFAFVLTDKGQILGFVMKLVPNRYFELTRTIADAVDNALGKYIRGTMMECGLVGLTIAVGLWVCGFNTNVVIIVGVIGGVTNAIPFVGTAMALIFGSIFALIAESVNPLLPFITVDNAFLGVVATVTVAHFLDNAIYQPMVVGGAVNIHPLAVILGVFGGSLAFGFAGLLLAIPTIVILKVVTETLFTELKAYKII